MTDKILIGRELLEKAYELGFHAAANWAERDDLHFDTGSPAYCAERNERLVAIDAPQQSPTMEDAIAAGDGTLHGAIDYWQNRALEAEAKLKAQQQEAVYWCREIGESDWEVCSKERYDAYQKDPIFDTKITHPAPSVPEGWQEHKPLAMLDALHDNELPTGEAILEKSVRFPNSPSADDRKDALQALKEQVAAIYCHSVGHPGTAMAFQQVVIDMIDAAMAAQKGEKE